MQVICMVKQRIVISGHGIDVPQGAHVNINFIDAIEDRVWGASFDWKGDNGINSVATGVDNLLVVARSFDLMDLEQCRSVKFGWRHDPKLMEHLKNDRGLWRINGKLKTWKTDPYRFRLPIKWGLREYGAITNENYHDYLMTVNCEPIDMELYMRWYLAHKTTDAPNSV